MVRKLMVGLLFLALMGTACSDDGGDDETGDGGGSEAAEASPSDDDGGADDDDGDDDDGGDGGSACDLLTLDDVTGAGFDAAAGPEANDLAPSDECTFEAPDGTTAIAVVVYTESEATALGPDLYPDSETLDGIGEEAWYNDGLGLGQARLASGEVVSIQDVGTTGNQDGVVELLTIAVG